MIFKTLLRVLKKAVANKLLNETTEFVGDIKRHNAVQDKYLQISWFRFAVHNCPRKMWMIYTVNPCYGKCLKSSLEK